jgi:hypothetical protein
LRNPKNTDGRLVTGDASGSWSARSRSFIHADVSRNRAGFL